MEQGKKNMTVGEKLNGASNQLRVAKLCRVLSYLSIFAGAVIVLGSMIKHGWMALFIEPVVPYGIVVVLCGVCFICINRYIVKNVDGELLLDGRKGGE